MPDITSANSVYTLTVPNLFPSPQTLQGYSADAAFETDSSESAEVMKGVDGITSYGYTPFLVRQTITLQADSNSAVIFETILEQTKTNQMLYPVFATILIPSIRRKYTCTTGIVTGISQISSARRVMQARPFVITWSNISPSAI